MLDASSPRFRLAALIAAGLALVLAAVAVVVMATRDRPAATGAGLIERRIAAADLARLDRDKLEVVVEAGQPVGVRVRDAELADKLGLAAGDVVTAIAGRPTLRDGDITDVFAGLSILRATTVYVDTRRGGHPAVTRWLLDGDLRDARRDVVRPRGRIAGPRPVTRPTPSSTSALDAVRATIEEIDETHYRLPRATLHTLLDTPLLAATGARIVPSIRNGRPNGFKLYAIRPSSIYAALGLRNGDTIHTVAGQELDSADRAADLADSVRPLDEVVVEVTRRGRPVTLTYTITP